MNHSKQILWHIILISLMNAMTYIYFGTYIWLYTPLFCSTLFAIIYYSLQLSLLYHIAKSSSKLIYFSPLLLVCRNFPNFMYCIFTREHPSYAYRKNFLHF